MKMKLTLLVTLMALFAFEPISGLKCHMCDPCKGSELGEVKECTEENTSTVKAKGIQRAAQVPQVPQVNPKSDPEGEYVEVTPPPPPYNPDSGKLTCAKIEKDGQIARVCFLAGSDIKLPSCSVSGDQVCWCDTDGCNGSRKLTSGGFAVTTLAIIILRAAI